MPSPSFDAISVQLSRRIGDTVAAAATAGTILTAAERNAYVNKALRALFESGWLQSGGDEEVFLRIFPELKKVMNVVPTVGVAPLPATGKDYFKLLSGYHNGDAKIVKAINPMYYHAVKAGINAQYLPSATNYFVFEISQSFNFFPALNFDGGTIEIFYIAQPVDPATGGDFTNGGTYDIPFYPVWTTKIAALAEQIYRVEAQERT